MPPSPATWSLRARLTSAATLAILLLLTLSGAVLVWRVDAAHRASTDANVKREATALASSVDEASKPRVTRTPGLLTGVAQIVDRNGTVVSASPDIDGEPAAFDIPVTPIGSVPHARTVEVAALDGTAYRVVGVLTSRTPGYRVYVGLPLAEGHRSTVELAGVLAVGVPTLTAVLAALTWLFAGRALRPVEILRRQAAEISVSDLHRRVDVPRSGDELSRLAATLNNLLERLDDSMRRQRQFVADAAHELRSPVAAIRTQAEVADHVTGRPAPSALADEAVRLTHLVDDLLALARIDAEPRHHNESVDLDDLVYTETTRLRQRTDLIIDTSDVTATQITGDSAQLNRALRNLLDNAARYATSRISVTVRKRVDIAEIVVADDGPGIPEADRARVLERFTRLDDARTRDTGGVGLGLAIVNDVVKAHGGQLLITDNEPGACVTIRLPREAAAR